MPDLCQDSDDDEDDILKLLWSTGRKKITGRDGTQEVQEGG